MFASNPYTPWLTRHAPSPVRSTVAPRARIALPVLMTSSPSSRPWIRVSPTVMAARMRARCEIDLSPGTRTRPFRPGARRAGGGGAARSTAVPSPAGAARGAVAPLAPGGAEAPEAAGVELVSLEEADSESGGGKKAAAAGDADAGDEDDVEVADDGAEDDTFLETDEDEGDDVSDIVGGEREDEEDT